MTGVVAASGAHGGDGSRVAASLGLDPRSVLDLSASLNPVAPDAGAVVQRHLHAVREYPDAAAARDSLAVTMGVDPRRLLLTNGGAEAIALVSHAIGGHVEEPEFSLHPRRGGPKWRSNPHNPTGLLAPRDASADVWDEAFFQLATGEWTRGDDTVVVGSLTKLFACPGLRLGYVLAEPEFIAQLAAFQPAWSVNSLALAAVPDLLELADLAVWTKQVGELRGLLTAVLDEAGLDPQPSAANFVLCRRAEGLRERLAPSGVVVRDCGSFGMPGCARIAVPDDSGRERLRRALGRAS